MKRITPKISTLRRATASGRVTCSPDAIKRLVANDLPKKDVLPAARIAAIQAAKKTPDIIPFCHPLPIDAVDVEFSVHDNHVDIVGTVEAIWKTGVEMEALTAVSVAALTIYDMLKPIDKNIVIESVKLDKKTGGKTDFSPRFRRDFTAAVVVTSDSTQEGVREDRSGKLICGRLEGYGLSPRYEVLRDDREEIVRMLRALINAKIDLILTTGGTGLGPRDVTVEATREVIQREVPGVMEAARAYGQQRTPYAMLSRGVAGVNGQTIIVNLPGSSRGADETLSAVFPAILHAFPMLQGEGH